MATQIKIIDTEKPKGLFFKQKWCSQSILKQFDCYCVEILMFVLIWKRRKLPRIINLSLHWIYNFKGATTDGLKSSEFILIKGKLQSKNVALRLKSVKNASKRAITDLNVPNGSRDILSQSQDFGQDGHCYFVGFQPHFQLNITSQTQCCKTI